MPSTPHAPSRAFREATGQTAESTRATPTMAFTAATELVLRGERIDMGALAAELGVARATLYRWTGDRDRLLADVVWAQMDAALSYADEKISSSGIAHLSDVIGQFMEIVAGSPVLRSLIANEGEHGVRMLLAPAGPFRPRLVARVTAIIDAIARRDGYRPPAPSAALADGIVALGERYLHNGGDPSLNPDPATARIIVGLLLRENP